MRVMFDGYWWTEGPLSNQMVQRQFIQTWLREYPADDVIVVVPRAGVERARRELPGHVQVLGTVAWPHAVAASVALSALARIHHPDVVVAHNFTPLMGPAVTFIHDVLFQTNPGWFTTAERAYLWPIPYLARRARAVATSTRHEAGRIRSQNPWLSRVEPVGLGISTTLVTAEPVRPRQLPPVDAFVLTVGRLNIRKNLGRTIEAALRSDVVTPRQPLVIVGEPDGRAAALNHSARAARSAGTIVFLDRVSERELAWLYAMTRLFVFVSLDEGFGLPPVEARHFGAPVLVSDIPVFRETLASRATFVDPEDVTAIALELARLLEASSVTSRLRQTADERGDGGWRDCTRRLRDLAFQVAAQR